MALYHVATLSPTKPELLSHWVADQPWCPSPGAPVEVIGAFRFDDPEGQVGMETHIVRSGDTLVQVPLTYRDAPDERASKAFIAEMEHSALGTRWVYDGLGDHRYLTTLAGVALTGQGEALGMTYHDQRWIIAPANVRIQGGGWTQERVPVDQLEAVHADNDNPMFRNDRFELTFHRFPVAGSQPDIGITARWDGLPDPVVLAEVVEAKSAGS